MISLTGQAKIIQLVTSTMVRIRLTRVGAKNEKKFRIVVIPARSGRDGKFLENLGFWQPGPKSKFKIDKIRYDFWILQGAKPSKTVLNLIEENEKKPKQ